MSTTDKENEHSLLRFVRSGYNRIPRGVPRYRDPANPARTWSGKGKAPAWVRQYLQDGRTLAEFEIKKG